MTPPNGYNRLPTTFVTINVKMRFSVNHVNHVFE